MLRKFKYRSLTKLDLLSLSYHDHIFHLGQELNGNIDFPVKHLLVIITTQKNVLFSYTCNSIDI